MARITITCINFTKWKGASKQVDGQNRFEAELDVREVGRRE
jgi:hypothetical protein